MIYELASNVTVHGPTFSWLTLLVGFVLGVIAHILLTQRRK